MKWPLVGVGRPLEPPGALREGPEPRAHRSQRVRQVPLAGSADTDMGPDRSLWGCPGCCGGLHGTPSPPCQERPCQQTSPRTVEGPWEPPDGRKRLNTCPLAPQPLPFTLAQNYPNSTERRTQDSQRESKHSLFNFYTFFLPSFVFFFFFAFY